MAFGQASVVASSRSTSTSCAIRGLRFWAGIVGIGIICERLGAGIRSRHLYLKLAHLNLLFLKIFLKILCKR
jgi:hypothetical protein